MAIFTAIGSAIAGAFFAAGTAAFAITSSLISAGLAFATNLVFSYLNRPKKREYSAVQGEKQFGGDVPVGALFGKGKVVGQIAKYMKWGSGNKYNLFVYVLSNGWCDGLEPYCYFYGERHTLLPQTVDGNEQEKYFVEGFDNTITIRFHDGRPGQLADERLLEIAGTTDNTWTATDRLSGMAYVTIELRYDADLLNKGMPEFEWVFRGLRCYDWRKDSTLAGGSGAHRLDDPATWEFTENPAVQRFNYQIGLRGLISNRTLIGEGKSIGQLDLDTYTVAANVADQDRTVGERTFKRYQCGIYVTGQDDHTEVLAEFDDALAGYAVNRRGLSGIIVGAPQIPVMELTADDIDMDRGKAVRYRKSVYEKFNHLSGQFISIEDNWNPASLDPITVNADVALDKRVNQTSNDFLQVSDPDVAQYLLTVRYRQQRLGGSITLPVMRNAGFRVQEGDWVTYRDRDWLVTEWQIDEAADITLILAETDAEIYADETIDPGPIIIPSSPPINGALLTTVQNFNVEVGSISGPDGYEIPALRCTWTPPEDPTIVSVRFEYVIGENPVGATVYRDRTDDPEAGEYYITKEVVPSQVHTARATIRTVPDRFKTFTAWVTTADPTGPLQVYPPGLVEELNDYVEDATAWIGQSVRSLIDEVKRTSLLTIDQDFANYEDKQQLRTELRSQYGRITAEYEEVITVATGPGSAIAQRLETLEVEIVDKASVSALNALTVRVEDTEEGLIAQADLIQGVEAEVGEVSASGTFRVQAQASPGDGWARVGLQVSANSGSTFETAAMFLDARTSGTPRSRAGFVADQFFITDGANDAQPFIYQDGILSIGEVRASEGFIENLIVNDLFVIGKTNITFGDVTTSTIKLVNHTRSTTTGGWTTIDTITVPSVSVANIQIVISIGAVGASNVQFRIHRPDNGAVFYATPAITNVNFEIDTSRIDHYPRNASTTYEIQIQVPTIGSSPGVTFTGSVVLLYGQA